ncbi:MAG TPA: hypothetical protein VLM81_00115 [Peptostreptococcaceae bacterium]|nr:hypothetical protein [Peptostreptococcaceae bacterium]
MEEDNVLVLNNFITEMELDYLYCGNKRYIKFCKKLYSVDIDKWSKYFWKLYITDVFEEKIKEQLSNIKDINNISKEIVENLQEERQRIVTYGYIQGYVFGYTNFCLNSEFSKTCEAVLKDKNKAKIHISDIMRSRHIKGYQVYMDEEINKNNHQEYIRDTIKDYCDQQIYGVLNGLLSSNVDIVYKTVQDILIKDCIQKNKDGIWDGIIFKVTSKIWKNNEIIV